MMRWKYIILPAVLMLAAPLAADAKGLFKRGSKGDDCATGNCGTPAGDCATGDCSGGRGRGMFANAPPTNTGPGRGFGLFQPPFQAAPWYLYWPYDQHFQLPAPINAPFIAPQGFGGPANPFFAPMMNGFGAPAGRP